MAWSPTPASPGPCSASGNPEAIAGWPMVRRLAASEPAVHQPAMRGPVSRRCPATWTRNTGRQYGAIAEPLACAVHDMRRLGPVFGEPAVGTSAAAGPEADPAVSHPWKWNGSPGPVGSILGPLAGRSGNRSAICVPQRSYGADPGTAAAPDPAPRTALSGWVPARLTWQAAAYRTGTPFGHIPVHAKGPLPAGKGP